MISELDDHVSVTTSVLLSFILLPRFLSEFLLILQALVLSMGSWLTA